MEKATREDLLAELTRLADELGRTPRMKDMREQGAYSRGPYYREFGNWNAALREAELGQNKREDISRDELIQAIHDLAEEVEGVPTRTEMNELGEFSRGPYDKEFGGWNDALRAAGYDVNKPARLDREELLKELERLAAEIERTPRQRDMNEMGEYSVRAYKRVFDSWNVAVEECGLEPNSTHNIEYPLNECENCGDKYPIKPSLEKCSRFCTDQCKDEYKSKNWNGSNNPHPNAGLRLSRECEWCGDEFERVPSNMANARFCDEDCLNEWKSHTLTGENSPRWRGGYEPYYGPNWHKQRRNALKRDQYRCQRCGKTENLVVHHKTPIRNWAKQDDPDWESANRLDNLVTVCRKCHAKIENGASNGFGTDYPNR